MRAGLFEKLDEQRWKLFVQGLDDDEMAAAAGCTPDAIRKWRKRKGLHRAKKRQRQEDGRYKMLKATRSVKDELGPEKWAEEKKRLTQLIRAIS